MRRRTYAGVRGGLWLTAAMFYGAMLNTAVGQPTEQQWLLLENSPQGTPRHEDIHMVSPEIGFIANSSGQVFRTIDGGESWDRVLLRNSAISGQPIQFRSTAFLTPGVGYIGTLTAGEFLWETRDQGESFRNISNRVPDNGFISVCGLWAASNNVIYGVGRWFGPARLIKSADRGQSWTTTDMSPYAGTLVDVYFWDERRGIVVGGSDDDLNRARAVVLLTQDGGQTWSTQHVSEGSGEWGWKISFPTDSVGYVSVERQRGAKVLKTTDRGETWSEILIEGSEPLQGIGFLTENIGWASGRGTTSYTTTGGDAWQTIDLDGDINRFRMFGDTLGYAVGRKAYRFTAPVVTASEDVTIPPMVTTLGAIYPNPSRARTYIPFSLSRAEHVVITVHDMLGRRMGIVADATFSAGHHEMLWYGEGMDGLPLVPGSYIVLLRRGDQVESRSVAIVN